MNILVIAAHPDDEVLGCGGTIARYASEGAKVSILILANGLSSRIEFDPERDAHSMQLHHERAITAGRFLGAQEILLAGLPDQKMDTVPILEITHRIETEISRLEPDTIFTHHAGDLNLDHIIAHRATMVAARPMLGRSTKRVYGYEVGSSTEWSFQQFGSPFTPTTFIDITLHLSAKISAMEIYESEVRQFPHPRSPQAIEAQARLRGAASGLMAAEAFQIIYEIL